MSTIRSALKHICRFLVCFDVCFIFILKNIFICLLESETAEGDVTPANTRLVSPFAKPDSGTRLKSSAYPLNRRPAGGLSRPLPSPGICLYLIGTKVKFGVIIIYGIYELWLILLRPCPIGALFSCFKN